MFGAVYTDSGESGLLIPSGTLLGPGLTVRPTVGARLLVPDSQRAWRMSSFGRRSSPHNSSQNRAFVAHRDPLGEHRRLPS